MLKTNEYVGFNDPKKFLEPVREVVGSEDSMYTSIMDFVKEGGRRGIILYGVIEQNIEKRGNREY